MKEVEVEVEVEVEGSLLRPVMSEQQRKSRSSLKGRCSDSFPGRFGSDDMMSDNG